MTTEGQDEDNDAEERQWLECWTTTRRGDDVVERTGRRRGATP
jgi:hypothetical protein